MSDTFQRIVILNEERRQIYAAASGRWLTETERRRIDEIAGDLRKLEERRRLEQAQQPQIEHELVIVRELGR